VCVCVGGGGGGTTARAESDDGCVRVKNGVHTCRFSHSSTPRALTGVLFSTSARRSRRAVIGMLTDRCSDFAVDPTHRVCCALDDNVVVAGSAWTLDRLGTTFGLRELSAACMCVCVCVCV
jgi:hypothetical protein